MPRRSLIALLLTLLCAACGARTDTAKQHEQRKESVPPERATGTRSVELTRSERSMVVAANPYAAQAGASILDAGGSAIDAAIAMSMVLTLVEPQSSGIGGGAFLLHFEAGTGEVLAYDGRETAPAAASEDMFLTEDGEPMPFFDAVIGGLSVGTPGHLRMLELAHQAHGALPWASLFEPAIELCEQGFEVSPRLNALLDGDPVLRDMPGARDYFYTEAGEPLPVGTVRANPELAEVLRAVAEGGADAFYTGPIAADIVEVVRDNPVQPGHLSLEDLAAYPARVRQPICRPFAGHDVCTMPPPTSGGITTLQILGLLQQRPDFSALSHDDPRAEHLLAEASRLAYADRGLYIGDADFVEVPTDALLNPDYLARRAALIEADASMGVAEPGALPGLSRGADASPELPSTTHLSVVDAAGNAVSMTASIEGAFGSHLFVRGFLLNNELTDFSFLPVRDDGAPVANRVQPGKRPRSSMSPTLVLDPEHTTARLAIGSPGGSRIIVYTTRALLAVLHHGLDVQHAISRPHVVNRNGATEIEDLPEHPDWSRQMADALSELGHETRVRDLNSGLHGIHRLPDGALTCGADPRREGLCVGR